VCCGALSTCTSLYKYYLYDTCLWRERSLRSHMKPTDCTSQTTLPATSIVVLIALGHGHRYHMHAPQRMRSGYICRVIHDNAARAGANDPIWSRYGALIPGSFLMAGDIYRKMGRVAGGQRSAAVRHWSPSVTVQAATIRCMHVSRLAKLMLAQYARPGNAWSILPHIRFTIAPQPAHEHPPPSHPPGLYRVPPSGRTP
jgi:hypothetical protein